MIPRIVRFVLRMPAFVVILALGLVATVLRLPGLVFAFALSLLGVGVWSYSQLDIEAYPNPVAPMIEIITQPQGWSAE